MVLCSCRQNRGVAASPCRQLCDYSEDAHERLVHELGRDSSSFTYDTDVFCGTLQFFFLGQ